MTGQLAQDVGVAALLAALLFARCVVGGGLHVE